MMKHYSYLTLSIYACSLHGLIRGENMELGRDSDTGGQVNVTDNLSDCDLVITVG